VNHRNPNTACSVQVNALQRVPKVRRRAAGKPATWAMVNSGNGKIAMYATLMKRGTSVKLIFSRSPFLHQRFRVPRSASTSFSSAAATDASDRYSERLNVSDSI